MKWDLIPLGEIAPADRCLMPDDSTTVWNLSLEDIEPQTGRVLAYKSCSVSELGSSKCCFDENHVLYSKLRPYLNKVVVPDRAGVGTTELIPMRPDSERLDREFLAYYLRSPAFLDFCKDNTRGANLPRISMKELWKHEIPLPKSVDEQRRIVTLIQEYLGRIDEISKLRAESTRESEHLLESQVEAILANSDGEPVSLGDVCQITSKLIDPRESQYLKLLHVGGANIESKTGILMDLQTAAEEGLKSGKFVFDDSIVLYNKIRPYLVKVARPEFHGLCSADMYPLKPDINRLTRDYLFYTLISHQFTRYAIAGSNRAGMPKVNRKHLFEYEFRLPPIDRQIEIAQVLDSVKSAIDELRTEMTEGQEEMEILRESILKKAFDGEL